MTKQLKDAVENFEITGPDADGLLWLVLHGKGTTGKAMFNLGSASRVAGQVAVLFEQQRQAALAALQPEQAEPQPVAQETEPLAAMKPLILEIENIKGAAANWGGWSGTAETCDRALLGLQVVDAIWRRLVADRNAAVAQCGMLAAAPQPAEPQPTRADLIAGLKFYAEKGHFDLADDTAWDTVSGEPQNFWCDEAGTATIEDGSVAAAVLAGKINAAQMADETQLAEQSPRPAPEHFHIPRGAVIDIQPIDSEGGHHD